MNLTLKDFQTEYVLELSDKLDIVRSVAEKQPAAALLNAPTGSGKTIMATALIEGLLTGTPTSLGDPNLTFVWVTDQPELNKQTYDKILSGSSELVRKQLVVIDASLDQERLDPGCIYFLNTQKLGVATSFVQKSDKRTYTLWEILQNTITADPLRFVLVIDEAHRGTQGRDAEDAQTIMEKFIGGSKGEIEPVPVVVGISATPEHFVNLCTRLGRPVIQVIVEPGKVRESGLIKDYVDLFHPDKVKPADVTMLVEAVKDWKEFRTEWLAYGKEQGESVREPVLVVQVEDARTTSKELSRTDLDSAVGTLARELGTDTTDGWIAHAFQDESDFTAAGHTVRYLAPSAIDTDGRVKVVLFKTSLNTGWDCPRAEVMVSFRTARDETNIAQLVGRMIRAPLARRVISNEHLNSVALYLPFYDTGTVEKVITRLTDPGAPPTGVRKGRTVERLERDPKKAACFEALDRIPSQTIPRVRPLKPVPRVARLASLLAETSLEATPVKEYRQALVADLLAERKRLASNKEFKKLVDESAVLDVIRQRLNYGAGTGSKTVSAAKSAVIADENVDDLFNEAGRQLGEGLHKEYLRSRVGEGAAPRQAKLELYALISANGVRAKIDKTAETLRLAWTQKHKAALIAMDEKIRQAFRDIEAAGPDPEDIFMDPPGTIDVTKAATKWKQHLYVDKDGLFPEDFAKSSWEKRTVEAELKRKELVGWLRNPDRQQWSFTLCRREAMRWIPFYPDFIFFAKTPSGILPEIVDPHLLAAEDMPQRAVRLAQYAQDHGDVFRRIEMVVFESAADEKGLRLDLMDEKLRKRIANITTQEQLKEVFAEQRQR